MPAVSAPWMRLPPYTVHARYTAQQLGEKVPWQIADYQIPNAWPRTQGAGVKVGIVDTGIDPTHMKRGDLNGAVAEVQDFSRSHNLWTDVDGHGTHVAGIIAARRNEFGIVGVAPQSIIYAAKVLGDNGSGSTDDVARGVYWCLEQGCPVINMSLGGSTASDVLLAAIRAAAAAGCVVVCAAGNEGGAVDYPGRYPECIAVSAVDKMRRIAPWSCRGDEVDVAAPGVEILSTYKGGTYASLSGTSMAAPFVTGLIALYLATPEGKDAKLADVMAWLTRTATDAGQPGRDPLYGVGLPGPKAFEPREPTPPPAPNNGVLRLTFPAGGTVTITGGVIS